MDEDQKQGQQTQAQGPTVNPQRPQRKKGSGKRWLIIIAILIVAAVGIFLIVRGTRQQPEASPTPTPFEPTQTTEPTEAPEPVDREDVSIEIFNGTGIAGEAVFLQEELEDLGYEDIEVGNASSQDYEETQVTFSSDLSEAVIDEITELLEDTYQDVSVDTDSDADVDVSIITGLRVGQTARPEETATPEPTEEPTESPTASPTETPEP